MFEILIEQELHCVSVKKATKKSYCLSLFCSGKTFSYRKILCGGHDSSEDFF